MGVAAGRAAVGNPPHGKSGLGKMEADDQTEEPQSQRLCQVVMMAAVGLWDDGDDGVMMGARACAKQDSFAIMFNQTTLWDSHPHLVRLGEAE